MLFDPTFVFRSKKHIRGLIAHIQYRKLIFVIYGKFCVHHVWHFPVPYSSYAFDIQLINNYILVKLWKTMICRFLINHILSFYLKIWIGYASLEASNNEQCAACKCHHTTAGWTSVKQKHGLLITNSVSVVLYS